MSQSHFMTVLYFKMNFIKVIFILTILTLVSAVKKSYEGYTLYKIVPQNEGQVKILEGIQEKNLGEFWDSGFNINHQAKVMVSPEKREEFIRYLTDGQIEAKIVIHDIQRAIDQQLNPETLRNQTYLSFSWSRYNNLEAIYAWLDELEDNHPGVAKTVVMGESVENREIKGIIINHHPERRPLIGVLEGTLHAREWISAATVTWIIKEFLTSNDPEVRALAENFEWHIFPVVNPDGYAYTFTTHRMWRKNRSQASVKNCAAGVDNDMSHGVDLNRNFDVEWMGVGANNDSCTNTYAGPSAFSEPESRAISEYVRDLDTKGELIFYIAFHSYTQLILVPYSHVEHNDDALTSGNYADMYEIAMRGADALEKRYGKHYRVGLSTNVMYAMSGTSFDWVKYAVKVPITYLIELRDLGEFGFLLPADQIVPTGEETLDALVAIGQNTRRLGYFTEPLSASASSVFLSTSMMLIGVLVIALFK